VLGERVAAEKFTFTGVRTMNLSSLNDGVYYMNVTANGTSATRKITINK